MTDSNVSSHFNLESLIQESTDEAVEVPTRSTLDGFAAEAINKPGLAIRGLEPWSLVDVQTANTLYRLTILDPYESLILIQGGRHFADVTEARLSGSSFGGSLLKLHFIGCGMHLEVTTDDMKVVTSQIQSVTVREADFPGPF
jgi:hypothetical protein